MSARNWADSRASCAASARWSIRTAMGCGLQGSGASIRRSDTGPDATLSTISALIPATRQEPGERVDFLMLTVSMAPRLARPSHDDAEILALSASEAAGLALGECRPAL